MTTSPGLALLRIDSSLDGNDAFGLEADVDEHLIGVDPNHGAGDDVTLFELEDGPLDGGGEVVGAQIVGHVSQVASER